MGISPTAVRDLVAHHVAAAAEYGTYASGQLAIAEHLVDTARNSVWTERTVVSAATRRKPEQVALVDHLAHDFPATIHMIVPPAQAAIDGIRLARAELVRAAGGSDELVRFVSAPQYRAVVEPGQRLDGPHQLLEDYAVARERFPGAHATLDAAMGAALRTRNDAAHLARALDASPSPDGFVSAPLRVRRVSDPQLERMDREVVLAPNEFFYTQRAPVHGEYDVKAHHDSPVTELRINHYNTELLPDLDERLHADLRSLGSAEADHVGGEAQELVEALRESAASELAAIRASVEQGRSQLGSGSAPLAIA